MRLVSRRSLERSGSTARALLAMLLLLLGCGNEPNAPGPSGPDTLVATTPTTMSVGAGATVTAIVRLTSPDGRPRAGVQVRFVADSGSGTVLSPTVVTDSAGLARTEWRPGTTTGTRLLRARLGAWGQLGDGTTNDRAAPAPAAAGLTFNGISVGQTTTCGMRGALVLGVERERRAG